MGNCTCCCSNTPTKLPSHSQAKPLPNNIAVPVEQPQKLVNPKQLEKQKELHNTDHVIIPQKLTAVQPKFHSIEQISFFELLVFGYLRHLLDLKCNMLPFDICLMIKQFYCCKSDSNYKYSLIGIKERKSVFFDQYFPSNTLSIGLTVTLHQLSSLIRNPMDIHVQYNGVIIKKTKDECWCSWHSNHKPLKVLNSDSKTNIEQFILCNGNNINIISNCGGDSYHTFIKTLDDKVYVQVADNYQFKCTNSYECPKFTDEHKYKYCRPSNIFILLHNPSNLHNLNIIQIQTGSNKTLFLTDNGDVYAVGHLLHCGLRYQQPTRMVNMSNITRMFIGPHHGFCVDDADQKLYCFGNNSSGQLGTIPENNHNFAMNTRNGRVSTPTIHPRFSGMELKLISCTRYHSGIIDGKGNTYMFGSNSSAVFGNGECFQDCVNKPFLLQLKCEQIVCGIFHTILLTDKNDIYFCGLKTYPYYEPYEKQLLPLEITKKRCFPRKYIWPGIMDNKNKPRVVRIMATPGTCSSLILIEND